MKPISCFLVALVLLGTAFAKERPVEEGRLVEIFLRNIAYPSPRGVSKTAYVYQMTVRVGCTEYVGAYSSEASDVAGAYLPGDPLEVSVTKHRIYVRTPGVEQFMEIQVSSQRSVDKCPAGK
jgi:hypothetical protein